MEKEEKEEMVDDGPTKGSMHFLPIDISKFRNFFYCKFFFDLKTNSFFVKLMLKNETVAIFKIINGRADERIWVRTIGGSRDRRAKRGRGLKSGQREGRKRGGREKKEQKLMSLLG